MKLDKSYKYPLSAKGEERVVERSKDRVSNYASETKRQCKAAGTHPDIATLVAPLFTARKEGGLGHLIKLTSTN